MGLDVVELVMEVEDEFQIRLSNDVASSLWKGRRDIQVRDFIEMVVEQTTIQRPDLTEDVRERTIKMICESANLPRSEVSLDSWFQRDLDLL